MLHFDAIFLSCTLRFKGPDIANVFEVCVELFLSENELRRDRGVIGASERDLGGSEALVVVFKTLVAIDDTLPDHGEDMAGYV